MLIGALISALNGALTKILSESMPALEIVFFRNLIGVGLIIWALKHTIPTLSGGRFYMLIQRGVLGFMAMILFFYTVTTIPLGEAITLNKTSPLFVAILAYYLLGEQLTKKTAFALFIGFLGIIFIVKPFGMSASYEHFLGVLGGFFAASAYTTIKKIKDIYDSRVIVLSFVGVGTVLPAVLFFLALHVEPPKALEFLFPAFVMPDSFYVWFLIFVMAFISTLSQWLLTKAYSNSNLSIVGVISYTNIPFAVGFGWMLGDSFPDAMTWIGIALIVIGGFLVGLNKKAIN
jgi:drug/metabolite transporter (DMT)-like permease